MTPKQLEKWAADHGFRVATWNNEGKGHTHYASIFPDGPVEDYPEEYSLDFGPDSQEGALVSLADIVGRLLAAAKEPAP